jgi:hypothetical protein
MAIKKLFIFLVVLLAPCGAVAAPCPPPPISAGFGQTFTNTAMVSGFLWDANLQLLYVMDFHQQYVTFIKVPQSTAQNFSYTNNADTFYTQNVENSFHEALEAQDCKPLLNQNGNILLSK